MRGTVKCPACGTKTYARRTHCPRCRAELTAAATAATPARPRGRTPLAVLSIVGLVVTAGVAVQIGTSGVSNTPGASARAVDAVRNQTAGPKPQGENATATANSMDLSRGGVTAYSSGDVTGSVAQFAEAVEADPKNAEALNNLGQALVRSGRAREAIRYFDQAIAVSNNIWTYHFNRAKAYAEQQDWPRAIAGYREAAGLFPQDYATAFNLARALQASGDLNAAIEEFQRAINLAPAEPDFPLALAQVLETARRPADAVSAYRRFLEVQDSGPMAEKVRQRIEELESKR